MVCKRLGKIHWACYVFKDNGMKDAVFWGYFSVSKAEPNFL